MEDVFSDPSFPTCSDNYPTKCEDDWADIFAATTTGVSQNSFLTLQESDSDTLSLTIDTIIFTSLLRH